MTTTEKTFYKKTPKPPHQQSSVVFFSTQYGNLSYKIRNIIRKNWISLQSDPNLTHLCKDIPTFSFRRAPIVNSHLPAPKQSTWLSQQHGTYTCGNCNHCHNVIRTHNFIDVFTHKSYKCRGFATYTIYVIYRHECECGCFYIGRTKRKFRERLAEHNNYLCLNITNRPDIAA